VAVGGDLRQLRKVVAKSGDLPVAEAKDLHERHRRLPLAGFVERDVDLCKKTSGSGVLCRT
jgi:hypothetical protein